MESEEQFKIGIAVFIIIIILGMLAVVISICNPCVKTNEQAIETTENVETTEPTETESTEATVIETIEPTETNVENPNLISLGRFTLTAYCSCSQCCGQYALSRPVDENGNEIVYGSIGVRLVAGVSIAVDPRVIPYGSNVVINGHTYTAHDTGGAINGNRIDVYFDNHQEALNFGVQYAEVFIVAS